MRISQTIFGKGHPRNIPLKLFQNLTGSLRKENFQEFPHVRIVQVAPIHHSHAYCWIKISWTNFEKGHARNIPVKLFQNLTSNFREDDFLRISLCLYSASSQHSPEPCLFTDKNFVNNFLTGDFREDFLRISLCQYDASRHHSPEPCLLMDQNFANTFWKGSPMEHSCEIISESDKCFQMTRFLKNCLKNSISFPWQQTSWWNQILWLISEEDLRRNIPGKLGPNWPGSLEGDVKPFIKRQILEPSKLKEFADDNFQFDENEGTFSKKVEHSLHHWYWSTGHISLTILLIFTWNTCHKGDKVMPTSSQPHYLLLDGIHIPNLSSLGILGTKQNYFPKQ